MAQLGKLPPEDRKVFGQTVNVLKAKVSEALEARKSALEAAALDHGVAVRSGDQGSGAGKAPLTAPDQVAGREGGDGQSGRPQAQLQVPRHHLDSRAPVV